MIENFLKLVKDDLRPKAHWVILHIQQALDHITVVMKLSLKKKIVYKKYVKRGETNDDIRTFLSSLVSQDYQNKLYGENLYFIFFTVLLIWKCVVSSCKVQYF
jgi:hypothetical protein